MARKFIELVAKLPSSSVRNEASTAAAEFSELRKIRNKLLHVQPGSTPEGSQRLISDGVFWEVETIDAAADAFTVCNDRLVALRDQLLTSSRVRETYQDPNAASPLGLLSDPGERPCRHSGEHGHEPAPP